MQKVISARKAKSQAHRLVNQEDMIQWRDPHCPSNQMLENGQCWVKNEIVSLENNAPRRH
ncbi:hypothetical protein [Amphritea balenae]|uniref:Uncharacterized protein n=1 Tax=Amphritea balenae TaxID=452629 RepID=A0A3P1SS11_9GAMM|nr:hypothetical protein [Amphritea balenae]RRC99900.1 hypothetical protein EHS89_06665 [Amphritea balenae]GGK74922.1 hypothetical protein GCM10007941_26250 [Amphritea balenae]